MRNRFQGYMRGPQWHSKTKIIAERGWHFPACHYAKSFSKVHAAPQWFSNTMITSMAEMGWHFPPWRYAKSFSRVYARPSMTFKTNDYCWEGFTFTSMLLCEIVFKSTCSPSMILKNNDYRWEGLMFSSMPLCEIVFRSICEALNDIQKQWL